MKILNYSSGDRKLHSIDLASSFGPELSRLPYLMRVLLENCLRHATGAAAASSTLAFQNWLVQGRSQDEIPFYPGRVLMHDTTCVPALVDIAAMRDAVAEAGGDPASLTPVLPVDVSVDHSVAVDRFGEPQVLRYNMRREIERNAERYRLMKWATTALPGVRVHPPGTGIMHTMNLEQLSSVIRVQQIDGSHWAVPDTLIGTDSHTPMVNGIGVLAWGVGGLEAESVMFGMPVMLRLPEVIGVRMTGSLSAGVLSTDLALAVTNLLRIRGVSGEFVEFFGPGVSTLTAGDRAVVANMAPEYGASTGYFPIDDNTISYLRQTGRDPVDCAVVERAAKAQGLWFDPVAEPRYTDVFHLELDKVRTMLAGPRRPQDLIALSAAPEALRAAGGQWPETRPDPIPENAVAIAAITSCTNTSDPKLLVAAGLLARNARNRGLTPPYWVKTSLAPGSPAAGQFLRRSGLLDDLEAVGFSIVGFGCTTCIGNSGPLDADMEAAIRNGIRATAVISGNRNFPGRIHPSLQLGFLASPPLVIAYALAGAVDRDISVDSIAIDRSGIPVYLKDLWPTPEEIDAATSRNVEHSDFASAFRSAEHNEDWEKLVAPVSPLFAWEENSTYIRRPPFASFDQQCRLGTYVAHPLLVLGDDVTTDHISPAGQIGRTSYAGTHLVENGDPPDDLNVYASRRGNWQAMVRGLFDNRAARNLLLPDGSAATAVHAPSGDIGPLWEIADRYRREGEPVVIVAGERYGAGSSRDWAAKGVNLLGVRAVLAQSFERIHRSNLIGMGILPVALPADQNPERLALLPGDRIEVGADDVKPRGPVALAIVRRNGCVEHVDAHAAVETDLESRTLLAGGMIPLILSNHLRADHRPGQGSRVQEFDRLKADTTAA